MMILVMGDDRGCQAFQSTCSDVMIMIILMMISGIIIMMTMKVMLMMIMLCRYEFASPEVLAGTTETLRKETLCMFTPDEVSNEHVSP